MLAAKATASVLTTFLPWLGAQVRCDGREGLGRAGDLVELGAVAQRPRPRAVPERRLAEPELVEADLVACRHAAELGFDDPRTSPDSRAMSGSGGSA